jgi:hypothetical protein
MTKKHVLRLAAGIVLGTGVAALAQEVPTLDVGTLCQAEAKQSSTLAGPCMSDQKRAREDLVKQWAQFIPDDRTSCLQMVNTVPGMQSYVELLTCLEMKRDARALSKK